MDGKELKKVYDELKELSKLDILIVSPLIDYGRVSEQECGPGESYKLIDSNISLLPIVMMPQKTRKTNIELMILKSRKRSDKIVNDDEQQRIFEKFCPKQ